MTKVPESLITQNVNHRCQARFTAQAEALTARGAEVQSRRVSTAL